MLVTMIPGANIANASRPATGRSASTVSADVWILVSPLEFSEAVVVIIINYANRMKVALPAY